MKITLPNGEEIAIMEIYRPDTFNDSHRNLCSGIEVQKAVIAAYESGKNSRFYKPEHTNWLDSVPENHKKFAQEWDSLGRPQLEFYRGGNWIMAKDDSLWNDWDYYRFKNDPHFELRLKWINSDKTLPIEMLFHDQTWVAATPDWEKEIKYREAVRKWEPPSGEWVIDPHSESVIHADCYGINVERNGYVRQSKEHAEQDLKLIRQFCLTLAWMRDKGYEPDLNYTASAFSQFFGIAGKEAFSHAIDSGELEL